MTTKLTNLIRKFHRDEEGLEALQVVMIIAIAAMVMIACATLGQKAVTWMNGQWTTLQGTSISADGGGAAGGAGAANSLAGLLGGATGGKPTGGF
jgi:Flp pilus assembly pilin Flp